MRGVPGRKAAARRKRCEKHNDEAVETTPADHCVAILPARGRRVKPLCGSSGACAEAAPTGACHPAAGGGGVKPLRGGYRLPRSYASHCLSFIMK